MARHIRKQSVRFDLQFQSSSQASAHAGQLAPLALLNGFGLWERIRQERALDVRLQKGKGFDPEVLMAQLLFCFTSGGVSLADAERLNEDETLKALLGVERFADQTTLGEWLREVSPAGWEVVRRLTACLFVPAGWLAWWRGLLAQLLPQCRQLGSVTAGTG